MKDSIRNGRLFLEAENEHDNAILSELWRHPLVLGYTRHKRKFMDKQFYPDELVTAEPKEIEIEQVAPLQKP